MKIKELVEKAYENANEKGFYNNLNTIVDLRADVSINYEQYCDLMNDFKGNLLMSIASEVIEAHNELREGTEEQFNEELADIVIRVASLAGMLGIDLEQEIINKMEKNKDRPYLHGKAF